MTMMVEHEGVPLVRTSTRTTFARCLVQWEWGWLEQRRSLETSNALTFGTMAHKALERWYQIGDERGVHPAETWVELCAQQEMSMEGFVDEQWSDLQELGLHLMEDYVDQYGTEPWLEIVAVEQPFELLLREEDGRPICIYCGTFDAIAWDHQQEHYVIMEHKTAANITTDHLVLDEQANTYWALAKYWLDWNVEEDAEIHHILYNFIRKGKRDKRPTNAAGQHLNKDGSVSKVQPPPRFHRERVFRGEAERQTVLTRIAAQVEAMKVYATGHLPTYKTPGDHCRWCPFVGACELEESSGDWVEMLDMTTEKEELYRSHLDNLEGVSLGDLVEVEVMA